MSPPGSGEERAAREDVVPGRHVNGAVHQKLFPVGERSEEPARLPGDVFILTLILAFPPSAVWSTPAGEVSAHQKHANTQT